MEKKILINKAKAMGQLRVACVEGKKLYLLEIEQSDHEQKVDKICNGEVISIEPSLEAAFVNFGAERNGFLPLKEIAPEYYQNKALAIDPNQHVSIKDTLFIGQKVLVQINKEERGTKGAALSTYITLAGRYIVLAANNPKAGGISKRIENNDREELRATLRNLKIPTGMGVIARTAAIGKSLEELQWDLDVLVNLWHSIKDASKAHGAPHPIHHESDVVIRTIRDHLRSDIAEIIIDDQASYEKAKAYIERICPEFNDKVKFYQKTTPLFSYYQIESQIEAALQRKVRLPAGGEIVIDRSEALTTIDVNSAQATKGIDIEETALNTNLEAVDEIAIQLRIRDLGGLFIIDFIDMEREESKRKIEDRMHEAFKTDRARVQIGRLSRFGLLEMSRQRLRPALNEASQIICPRCHGQGTIRNIQSQALSVIHLLEEKSTRENPRQIRLQAPIALATYLINEHRNIINNIEQTNNINIIIIPNPHFESPQFEIECVGKAKQKSNNELKSYELIKTPEMQFEQKSKKSRADKLKPAVTDTLPKTPAPSPKTRKHAKKPGIFKRLINYLFGTKPKIQAAKKPHKRQSYKRRRQQPRYKQTRQSGSYRRSRRSGSHKKSREEQRSSKRNDSIQKISSAKSATHKKQDQNKTKKYETNVSRDIATTAAAATKEVKQQQVTSKAASYDTKRKFPKTTTNEQPQDMVQIETKRDNKQKE